MITRSRLLAGVSAALVVVLVGPGALAGTIRDDTSDSLYTSLANTTQYASVGQFVTPMYSTGTSTVDYMGSGTLVGPQWVLTAAHVADNFDTGIGTTTFTIGGKTYTPTEVVDNPSWDPNNQAASMAAGDDLSLVKLSAPVTNVVAAGRYTGTTASLSGKTITYVGFGSTGTGLTGSALSQTVLTMGSFIKRAGQNVVATQAGATAFDAVWGGGTPINTTNVFVSQFLDPRGNTDAKLPVLNKNYPLVDATITKPLALGYSIAPGDSGGGAFINGPSGLQLVGINDFGEGPGSNPGMYGDISADVSISSWNSWINSVIGLVYPWGNPAKFRYLTAPNLGWKPVADGPAWKSGIIGVGGVSSLYPWKISPGNVHTRYGMDAEADILDGVDSGLTPGDITGAPEPASAVLLLAGLPLLLRRRITR
jgi:hypothetical protein